MAKTYRTGAGALRVRQGVVHAFKIFALIVFGGKVHTCRKGGVGHSLRVLGVCPLQFETLCHSIVGHVLFALHRAQVAKVKVAAKAVALVVVGLGTQAPRALGVDFAQGLEVHIVVDGPIVATIAQVKSAARFVAIRWHDKAR